MIVYPIAKINLGLNIVGRRTDGYHDLETVFFPIQITDEIEAVEAAERTSLTVEFPNQKEAWQGAAEDNLVMRAYRLLAADFQLPHFTITLRKNIPAKAGMGGGSSDAAYMLRLINDYCALHLGADKLREYAAYLGADCTFFIEPQPSYVTGIGDRVQLIEGGIPQLKGKYLLIVKPDVSVSTAEAYKNVTPKEPQFHCLDIIKEPLERWKDTLRNDFEESLFPRFPLLADIKRRLYEDGAVYAAMSGSGSTIYGIFLELPNKEPYAQYFSKILPL